MDCIWHLRNKAQSQIDQAPLGWIEQMLDHNLMERPTAKQLLLMMTHRKEPCYFSEYCFQEQMEERTSVPERLPVVPL